jgi:hypothetical protein
LEIRKNISFDSWILEEREVGQEIVNVHPFKRKGDWGKKKFIPPHPKATILFIDC